MILKRFYDEGLAHASYLLGCAATGEALVVDANRNLQQYIEAADSEDLRITHITETHIHADFVSGSRELARLTGAGLYLSDEGGPDWKYAFAAESGAVLLKRRDRFRVGNIEIEALHTPGHTPEHLSFLVTDTPASSQPIGLFSGDFVFVGDVGRPDLLERAANVADTMVPGARQLFKSLQEFRSLPDHIQIWPAHGAGSACGKSLGGVPQSTVGYEKIANWALQIEDEDAFVRSVLAGQPDPPPYFAEMKRVNKLGPELLSERPNVRRIHPQMLASASEEGTPVYDARPADSFAAAHLPGAVSIPLNRGFANWAGWFIPYSRPFIVITESEADQAEVDQKLSLIGLEQNVTYAAFDASLAKTRGYRRLTGSEALEALSNSHNALLLDVRTGGEWDREHIPNSVHIPLNQLRGRLSEIPRGRPVLITCQSGNRSPIAASILQAAGYDDLSDVKEGINGWHRAGNPLTR